MMRGIAPGLHAALLLARGRSDAIGLVAASDDELAAARRSFWAAPLCLPAFICLHLLDAQAPAVPPPSGADFARDLVGFAIGWAGYALLSHQLVGAVGRAALWPRFITLWNWCNLVQYLMLVAALLPALLGMPDWIGQTAFLAAIGWAVWLQWFMTRLALGLPRLAAAGFVAMDLALGLIVAGLVGGQG